MSTLIRGENLSKGWLRAIEFLLDQPGASTINLLVDLEHPLDEDGRIRTTVDELLTRRKLQPVDTVANTIFPEYLYNPKQPIDRLFERYKRIMPRLRRSGNPKGTYFWRLINWAGRDGEVNQLQEVIERLRSETRGRKLPAVYELVLYAPGVDRRPIGFPCLSYVSLKLMRGSVHMTAVYPESLFHRTSLWQLSRASEASAVHCELRPTKRWNPKCAVNESFARRWQEHSQKRSKGPAWITRRCNKKEHRGSLD